MWAITDCAVPVIGAINGPALGAGLALAACCDILVASEHATFGTTEINVGLLGASAHLSLLVGRHKAREMFFTGEQVPADELYRIGAVRAVVPRAELLPAARALAATLAAKSPIALRLAKESMNRVEFLPLKDAYRTEQDYTAKLLRYEDASEARQAFLEKRDPRVEVEVARLQRRSGVVDREPDLLAVGDLEVVTVGIDDVRPVADGRPVVVRAEHGTPFCSREFARGVDVRA